MTGVDSGPGVLLADRYRLRELVAVGGMGEVWRAEDTVLARTVAVKVLRPEYVGDDEFRARFRAEARHAAGLAHPGIASVYDFGETAERAWLVMELVDGEPLSALLSREGALGPDRTLDVVAQTAAALQVAHDGGVVHRDIKPGNLLLRPDGVVKVTDFGIASASNTAPMTRVGTVVGTAYYLSPEQASGRGAVPASDLYSLGVVAHECLTGRRPFPFDDPIAVALAHLHDPPPPLPDTVPAPVRQLVAQLLAKDPAERPGSGAELSRRATDLRNRLPDLRSSTRLLPVISSGASSGDASPGVTAAASAPHQPHRRAVRAVALVLLILALGLGLRSLAVETDGPGAGDGPGDARSVRVPTAELIGRPAQQVQDRLTQLGLTPRLVEDGSGQPAGTVSAVEPTGAVPPGAPVTVHVVPPPAPVRPPAGEDNADQESDVDEPADPDKGKGRSK